MTKIRGLFYENLRTFDSKTDPSLRVVLDEREHENLYFTDEFEVGGLKYNAVSKGYGWITIFYIDQQKCNLFDKDYHWDIDMHYKYGADLKTTVLCKLDLPQYDFSRFIMWEDEEHGEEEECNAKVVVRQSDDIMPDLMEFFGWGEICDSEIEKSLNSLFGGALPPNSAEFKENFLQVLYVPDEDSEQRLHVEYLKDAELDLRAVEILDVEEYYLLYIYERVCSIPTLSTKQLKSFADVFYRYLAFTNNKSYLKTFSQFVEGYETVLNI